MNCILHITCYIIHITYPPRPPGLRACRVPATKFPNPLSPVPREGFYPSPTPPHRVGSASTSQVKTGCPPILVLLERSWDPLGRSRGHPSAHLVLLSHPNGVHLAILIPKFSLVSQLSIKFCPKVALQAEFRTIWDRCWAIRDPENRAPVQA